MGKIILILLLGLLSLTSLFIGVIEITITDLFSLTDQQTLILFTSRLPRLISVLIAGASLSICGLIMQQLSQNRFVAPTTAGTLESARFGILIALLFFPAANSLIKVLLASFFALFGTFIFMHILRKIKFKDPIFIPLIGLMFGGIIGSLGTFIAYKYDLIQNVTSWLLGDFSGVLTGHYEMLYLSVPLLLLAYIYANQFSLAGMGEDFAKSLGLNYHQIINIGLTIVAIVTAVVVLTVGIIPFLGLIVPNIIVIYKGDNLKEILPYTALLGALIVLVCDIFSRIIIHPYELPISITLGIIGSLVFIILIFRRNNEVW